MTDKYVQRPWQPDPAQDVVLDARLLRVLSHPLRNKIMKTLRLQGPDNATGLAAKLGVNTGATSYHLRQLADVGLITEDEERGTGRDRWWKSTHRSSYVDTARLTETDPDLAGTFFHSIAQTYAESMFRYADEIPSLDGEWADAGTMSDWALRLTADELTTLLDELWQVIARYRRHDEAAEESQDTRTVILQVQAFPEPRGD